MAPPRATGPLAPATGALLGVHPVDSHSAPIDEENQKIITTEKSLGRTLDIDNSYYSPFEEIADGWEPGNPDKRGLSKLANWDVENGRIPLVGLACASSTAINNGSKDDVIRKTAQAYATYPTGPMPRPPRSPRPSRLRRRPRRPTSRTTRPRPGPAAGAAIAWAPRS